MACNQMSDCNPFFKEKGSVRFSALYLKKKRNLLVFTSVDMIVMTSSRTKHIAVRYHFIKEHVEKGTIELYFVKTDYQLADLFTKALLVDRFNYLVRRLGFPTVAASSPRRVKIQGLMLNPTKINLDEAQLSKSFCNLNEKHFIIIEHFVVQLS
ncbi:hypothetical protein Tco_0110248 [Tanacetum coccineum]